MIGRYRQLAAARCPSCGAPSSSLRTVGHPREAAGVVLRKRACSDCGHTAILLTAWVEGPFADVVTDYIDDADPEAIDELEGVA